MDLVVTDLDGTLWELETSVHERTRSAMSLLADTGTPLLVATGRRVGSTRAPLSAIGLAPPAVVLNGALGIDLSSGERFHRGGFDPADARAVLGVFHDHDVEPCVYVDHDDQPVWVGEAPSTHPEHLAGFGDDVTTGDLWRVVEAEHVMAFGVLGLPESVARDLGAALGGVASPHVDRDRQYRGYTVTVAPRSQSKWDGVAAFCSRHGLDAGAVMAIGDGPNDLELLDNAAISVVPSDAHADARAHADHVVGCAADGGWADILDILGIEPGR